MRPLVIATLVLFSGVLAAHHASAASTHAYAVCSDFMTGSLSAVDLSTRAVSPDVASIGSDAVARWQGGLVVVVNRYGGDNIQEIDPNAGYGTVRQFSVGNGSNPQDIVYASATKAYVSRYGSASIQIVNPTTGALLSPISLAEFADSDGLPEMARMVRVDRWLFVACQRLTSFSPSNPSMVVVVDTQADTVLDVDSVTPGKQAITLALRNPVTSFAFDRARSRLLIGCSGFYGANDGGIEAIDPVGLTSLGVVLPESTLNGDVGDVAVEDGGHAYALVTRSASNALISWDQATGDTLHTIYQHSGGFSLPDMELNDRHELYVCLNDFSTPGLLVFNTATDLLAAGPLATGLPPVSVTFDLATDRVLGTPLVAPATGVELSAPWPNPASGAVRLAWTLPRAGEGRADVFDVAGRHVRTLASGVLEAGRHDLRWDLRDEGAQRVQAGVYLVRARSGASTLTRQLVVVP